MANSKNTPTQDASSKKVSALDSVAHKLLSTIDSGFSERQILNSKDQRIQNIINDELNLAKGVSGGSIVDFVTTMTSNKVNHQTQNPMADIDSSELFTKDIGNIFGYFQDMYKNRYIELTDLKFISKFIPALGEAVKTTLDSIVGSDDLSATLTRNLILGDILTDEEKAQAIGEIERIEKSEKLLKKLRNGVYKKALVGGSHYIYAVSYSELFQEYDRLLKAGKVQNGIILNTPMTKRSSNGVGKKGFNLANESTGYESDYDIVQEACGISDMESALEKSNLFSKDELKKMNTSLEGCGLNVQTSNSPFLTEALEALAANDIYMNDLSGYANTFGGVGKLNDKFYGVSDGTGGIETNPKGSKFNTTGTYIKYIDASKIVPVKVYNQMVGYFHVHDATATKKANALHSDQNALMGSVNLFANINLNDNKREDAVRLIVDTISDGIIANFSNRFVNNNSEYKKLIADCIVANGMVNNNLQIQFIPASQIIPFVVNEDDDGIGQSILSDSLFPARLLLNLIISKMLLYMNKSGNRTLAFVRKGPIDMNNSNHIQRTLRQLQESNITFADLLSTNLSFAKFAPYGNLQIPTARNGDRLVDFETQEGQTVDMKPEFEDWLEKMAIMGTGVPSVILEYTDAADYAKSIVTANIKFAGRVATYQSDLEEATTLLYKILIQNSNLDGNIKEKVLRNFAFKLPRPRVIANANLSDYLSTMQSTATTLADLYLGQDPGEEVEKNFARIRDEFIKQTVIDSLPFISWDECKTRFEMAKLNVIQQTKLKDNVEEPPQDLDSAKDDLLADDDELL